MAGDYNGPAELLDRNGNVVDTVSVQLHAESTTDSSPGSWGGQIEATDSIGPEWDDVVSIRLGEGVEVAIVIEKENIRSAEGDTIRTGTIRGLGQPPI